MRQDHGETLEGSLMELLHRANTYGDLEAWAAFQQGLEEAVLTWFHGHLGSEAVCRVQSEKHFVARAFERLRQTALQRQVTFETLPKALLYLQASLCGAILETQRASSRPKAVSLFLPEEPSAPDHTNGSEVWEILQTMLQNEREQRLAYLLFHCGLSPKEIMHCCPQEWSDVQEIHHLRCNLLKHLLHTTNQLS